MRCLRQLNGMFAGDFASEVLFADILFLRMQSVVDFYPVRYVGIAFVSRSYRQLIAITGIDERKR